MLLKFYKFYFFWVLKNWPKFENLIPLNFYVKNNILLEPQNEKYWWKWNISFLSSKWVCSLLIHIFFIFTFQINYANFSNGKTCNILLCLVWFVKIDEFFVKFCRRVVQDYWKVWENIIKTSQKLGYYVKFRSIVWSCY